MYIRKRIETGRMLRSGGINVRGRGVEWSVIRGQLVMPT